MKRKKLMALGLAFGFALSSMGMPAFAEEAQENAQNVSESNEETEAEEGVETEPEEGAEVEAENEAEESSSEDYRSIQEDGTVIEMDGYTIKVTWCGEEGARLFGRMYYPAGFDETQEYTTVIMNHGASITCDIWDTYYAPALAKQGYVCYAFDSRSGTGTEGSDFGRDTYSDPTESGEASVADYSDDLNVVMDFIEAMDYVDKDHLYLVGQSKGGMTVQNVAAQRADEVAGLIVLYGSIGEEKSSMLDNYEELAAAPYNQGEVLFIQGMDDAVITVDDTVSNMEWYELATSVMITEADHGFGYMPDRPTKICTENMINFIERTSEPAAE